MADLNASLLNDKFNIYYERAKSEHRAGNLELARRNYLLAAESLMKLAKLSSARLGKVRIERAKQLAFIADNIKNTKITSEKKSLSEPIAKEGKNWQIAQVPNVRFEDVVGLEDVKYAISMKMINPLKYPDKYKIYNKKTGGGILLYGPPGTGKTMIAKAIACEVGAKFYVIKGSDIVSKWVGESEKNINMLFEQAKNDELAIIFIDEMDSLIANRGLDTHNDKRVNEFLQQIDGFASKSTNLLLLGATNRPWDIDVAALRSGRFSEKIYVPLPDEKARKFLFEKYLKDMPMEEDINFDQLVDLTANYSGADIEQVCDKAKEEPLLEAIKTDKVVKITFKDLKRAIESVIPNMDKKTLKKYDDFGKKK